MSARNIFEPHSKIHRILLKSSDLLNGSELDGYYTLQGIGLGGTIKHGCIYVDSFFCDTVAGAARFARGASGSVVRIGSRTIPFTDPSVQYSGNGTINALNDVFQVIPNNFGNSGGTTFAFVADYEPENARKFENWNTAQPLNINIEALDGTALTEGDFTPSTIMLVVVQYPEPAGQPLNREQITAQ